MKSLVFFMLGLLVLFGAVLMLKSINREPAEVLSVKSRGSEQDHTGLSDSEELIDDVELDSDSMRTFTDKQGNYRIKYPRMWKVQDKTASKHMIRADFIKDNTFGFQIRVHFGMHDDLKDYTGRYVSQFMSDMSGHWKGEIYETDRWCDSSENGDRCTSIILFERADGQNWFFKEYLFQDRNNVVIMQCGCRLEDRDDNESDLDEIIETFEFLH